MTVSPDELEPVDSILVVSFGGPEGPADVLPFLKNVTRGRNIPDSRLEQVGEHYMAFGGRSPINDQNRAFIAALSSELAAHGPDLPIYWGNRNWQPYLADTIEQMKRDGRRHAVAFVTSAYSSFSGCRQYRNDIAAAQASVGEGAPHVTKVRQFYNHPGFVNPMARNVDKALAALPASSQAGARLVFTAHSIPMSMASKCRYQSQLLEAARLIVDTMPTDHEWDLVFQSRSGSPTIPWLEPDICEHLQALHDKSIDNVVMVPIGFVSDHMEVAYDLDTEALQLAESLNMRVTRAATVGTDGEFIAAARELILEEIDSTQLRRALGNDGVVGCLGPECCPAH